MPTITNGSILTQVPSTAKHILESRDFQSIKHKNTKLFLVDGVAIAQWLGKGLNFLNTTQKNGRNLWKRRGNQGKTLAIANHGVNAWHNFKSDIEIIVHNGQIIVKANGKLLMEARGPGIDKNELNNLLVSGGWGGQGTWTIAAEPKQVKGQQTKLCSKLRSD